MDFAYNDDHLALRDAVQRFCETEYPAEHRGQAETPEQRQVRHRAMADLGLHGLTLDPEHGGSGLGAVEAMVVAQELGRALADGGFVSSTVLCARLIGQLGSPAQREAWLPALAAGRLQVALAVYEDGLRYDWTRSQARASALAQGWRIEGRKTLVLGGEQAQLWLVLARTSGQPGEREGLSLLAVPGDSAGVQMQAFDTLDGRRAAHLDFAGCTVPSDALLGPQGGVADALEMALDAATAALCAEAAGALESLLAHTAEHLRTRKQFGAPLAKFQVLQHRVADMLIALEQIKSMACASAMAIDASSPAERRRLVSAAKVLTSQAGRQWGLAAIQMHGAMGMTDECRVGHYAKRLMVIGQLFGDAAWHLRQMRPAA